MAAFELPELQEVKSLLLEVKSLLTARDGGKWVYTARELAVLTSYPESFIKAQCRTRQIPGAYQDMGKGKWFIPREAALAWLEKRQRLNAK